MRSAEFFAFFFLFGSGCSDGQDTASSAKRHDQVLAPDAGAARTVTAQDAGVEGAATTSAAMGGGGGAPNKPGAAAAGGAGVAAYDAGVAGTDAGDNQHSSPLLIAGTTTPLAVIAGYYGPDYSSQDFYSGDLGLPVAERETLHVLFGDSWVSTLVRTIDPDANVDADDAIATLSLRDFPDAAAVETWLAQHPASIEPRTKQRFGSPPPLTLALNASGKATPLRQVRDGQALTSGMGSTPSAGWSNNAADPAASALFGVFFRNANLECSEGACPGSLTCDTGLGLCSDARFSNISLPCVIGSTRMNCGECRAAAGGGMCLDTQSSVYDAAVARGRTAAVAVTHEVGNQVHDMPTRFATQPWITQRFRNVTARAVAKYEPASQAHDYSTPKGNERGQAGVFLWGRPDFGGLHKQQRDAQLYLAWAPMPEYAEDGHFRWEPRFFSGLDADGAPQLVTDEAAAQPLDLDLAQPGEQPEELIDAVGQMSVVYLPKLNRWLMLYGGNLQTTYAGLIYADETSLIDQSTLGPIYMRSAEQPWGPWTSPVPFAEAGDPQALTGLYAPDGGILRSTACTSPQCIMSEIILSENGWLYAPNIVEPWLAESDSGIDILWHVSTWNPYQVVLLKTQLLAM